MKKTYYTSEKIAEVHKDFNNLLCPPSQRRECINDAKSGYTPPCFKDCYAVEVDVTRKKGA